MKPIALIALCGLIFIAAYCPGNYEFEYDTIISNIPVNLEKLNSAYNDFNSDLPYSYQRADFCFSATRYPNEGEFNIIYSGLGISYHKNDDVLDFHYPVYDNSSIIRKFLEKINTSYNELGPYTFFDQKGNQYMFYANDELGKFDISFVYSPQSDWGYNGQQRIFGPLAFNLNSSQYDDLYPSISKIKSEIYFCSNRENNQFDIFQADINLTGNLIEYILSANKPEIRKNEILSGSSDDKCPFVENNLLVFVSDRPGGFGGYDIYYSQLINNQWSAPVNFGNIINSANNDYRPIVVDFNKTDFMIFSSDRPGGKGGYDLYAVRIGNMMEPGY